MNVKKRTRISAPRRRRERGDALIDAMVASLLVLILGMGPMYVAQRAAITQRQGGLEQVAASELRSILLSTPRTAICTSAGPVSAWANAQVIQVQGHASSGSGSGPTVSMTVTALCQNVDVVIDGVTVSQVMPTLVGCMPASTGFSGPLVMREGGILEGEPAVCADHS